MFLEYVLLSRKRVYLASTPRTLWILFRDPGLLIQVHLPVDRAEAWARRLLRQVNPLAASIAVDQDLAPQLAPGFVVAPDLDVHQAPQQVQQEVWAQVADYPRDLGKRIGISVSEVCWRRKDGAWARTVTSFC